MTSFYRISTTCKSILFTSMVYGWFIPTVWVADQVGKLFPTRSLDSSAWVIEEGVPNTSWDLVSVDASWEVETDADDVKVEIQHDESEPHTDTPTEPEIQHQNRPTPEKSLSNEKVEVLTQATSEEHRIVQTKRTHPVRKRFNVKPKSRPTTKRNARTGRCDVKNPDIEQLGTSAYSVPKRTVKHYSTHWKQASRLAHLSWAMNPDGSRLGVRIRAISCRSPLKFTGLKRGDVVVTINGHSVQSEKDLLKVYGKLLFWKQMKVEVKRGHKLVTLRYDIV